MADAMNQATQALARCRGQLQQLYQVAAAEKQKKLQRWHDELPMLESYIAAMTSTKEIIQKEQKQLRQELVNVKEHLDRQSAQLQPAAGQPSSSSDANALRQQLAEVRERVATIDAELQQIQPLLAGGCRADEQLLYQTKLVVLQDTRRLLQQEEGQLLADLKRVESAARLAADQAAVEALGCGDLAHLAEQLAGIEAKLDRAKVSSYFPEVKGYQYTGGGAGVYCAAKELHVSEVSGSFALSLDAVTKPDGTKVARLTVRLAGVSASDYSLSKQRHHSPRRSRTSSMKAARLAAEKLQQEKLAQQRKQQQKLAQALQRSDGGATPAAGRDDGMGGLSGLGPSGGKRGAAVAKFLGGLADKREQLAARINGQQAAAEGGAASGGSPTKRFAQLEPFTAEVRSSFTKLAASFADKRRGPSRSSMEEQHSSGLDVPWLTQQQQQQQQQQGSGSWAAGLDAGAAPAAGGVAAASVAAAAAAGVAAADSIGNLDVGGAGEQLPPAGTTPSSAAASAREVPAAPQPGSSGGVAASAVLPSAGVQTPSSQQPLQQQQQQLPSPLWQQQQQLAASPGSGGSSMSGSPQQPSAVGSSPANRQQELKQKFSSSLGGLKGRFSNFVDQSKAVSKQLLDESKVVSKQLLDESKAGAKQLLAEGRTGAKHLLEDSKQKLVEGKVNLQRHISRGSSTGSGGLTPTATAGGGPFGSGSGQQAQSYAQQQQQQQQPSLSSPLHTNTTTTTTTAQQQPPAAPATPPPAAAAVAEQPRAPPSTTSAEQQQAQGPQQQQQQQQQQEVLGPGPLGEGVETPIGTPSTPATPAGSSPATPSAAGAAGGGGGGRESAQKTPGGGTSTLLDEAATGSSTARRGVYITLLAQHMEVLGEKGTKVPNISVKEIALEVEATFAAIFEYSPLLGWQAPAGLSFEVLGLERRLEGSNLPLPVALVKSLLNMIMPSVFTKLFLTSLPHELGAYIVDSGRGLSLSGELRCFGPPLACLHAPVGLGPADMPRGRADVTRFVQELRAAQKARAMLSLPELQQAKALDLLLSPSSPYCLMPEQRPPCLLALCWLYLTYKDTSIWQQVCEGWQEALSVAATTFNPVTGECQLPGIQPAAPGGDPAAAGGLPTRQPPPAAHGSERAPEAVPALNFKQLMEGPVATLCCKPVRVSLGLQQLELGVVVEPALKAVRDYCERVMRDFEKNARPEDRALLLQRPLSEQLESLELWYSALLVGLQKFTAQFKSAGCDLLAAADREGFQLGAEGAHYEGPLKLQVPLPVLLDAEEGFVFNVALPDPRAAADSLAFKVRYILHQLMKVAFGEEARQADFAALLDGEADVPAELLQPSSLGGVRSSLDGAGVAAAAAAAGDARKAAASALEGSTGAPGTADGVNGGSSSSVQLEAPLSRTSSQPEGAGGEALLVSPLVGRVTLRRLGLSLKLDEKRLSELLGANTAQDANLVGSLLGCFGTLFSTSLDTAWCQDPADSTAPGAAPSEAQRCVLRVANNEITRVRCDLESVLFQSCLAPAITTRLLHAVALAVAHKLQQVSGKQLRWLDKVFKHLHEYCNKDSLDLLACLHAGASVGPQGLQVQLSGKLAQAAAAAAAAGSSGGAAGAAAAKQPQVWPVYLINDVNMLTVLDTVKLMMDN